jgi:hypothetical protein
MFDLRLTVLVMALSAVAAVAVRADGSAVDKVYHPYVEQLEWELEWRMIQEDENAVTGVERQQIHKFGLGKAVSEFVFVEAYLIGEQSADESFDIEAYEVELLWQMSEQGEFAVDYGLLFEIEKANSLDVWEVSSALLLEKELGRYSATANVVLAYEWGDKIDDEFETALALQGRYRYSPRFEPAMEFFLGEDTSALGPAIMGMERLGLARAVRWELGVVFALNDDTPDYTFRAVLEYEF